MTVLFVVWPFAGLRSVLVQKRAGLPTTQSVETGLEWRERDGAYPGNGKEQADERETQGVSQGRENGLVLPMLFVAIAIHVG